jgi:sugar lactone lactonase YvrE
MDVFAGKIWRMPRGGALQEWVTTGGYPTGTRFGPGGDLFVADGGRRAILRFSVACAEETVYVDQFEGQAFLGPNDLSFGPDGRLYFTDPEGSSLDLRIGAVYAVSPDGTVAQVAAGLAYPNGIAVTSSGSVLVVAETHTGILRRYSLIPNDGYLELEPLVTLSPAKSGPNPAGPDGMAFGSDGNLYVAHFAAGVVHVIAPDGSMVSDLPIGEATPTNVAFWEDSLYVTAGTAGSIYRLDIGVGEQRPFMRPW